MTDIDSAVESAVQDAFTRALTNFKGTYFFEKKVSDGNYGSNTYGVHVQFDYAPDASGEEFLATAREAALRAGAFVYEQAGIEVHRDAGGVLREVQDVFPGSTVERTATDPQDDNQERQSAASAAVGPTPPHSDDEVKAASGEVLKAMRRENAKWAKARFETHPQEFKDQRASNEANGTNFPDYQHKRFWKAGFYVD